MFDVTFRFLEGGFANVDVFLLNACILMFDVGFTKFIDFDIVSASKGNTPVGASVGGQPYVFWWYHCPEVQ